MKVLWEYNEQGLRPIDGADLRERTAVEDSQQMETALVEAQIQEDISQSPQSEAQEQENLEVVSSDDNDTAPPIITEPVQNTTTSTVLETSTPDLTSTPDPSDPSVFETPGIHILSMSLADDPNVILTEAERAEVQKMVDNHNSTVATVVYVLLCVFGGLIVAGLAAAET